MKTYSAKQLQKAGRNVILPFLLPLEDHPDVLCCEELFRLVPGRRAVLLSKWNEKQVIAKLFFHPLKFKRHIRQEIRGTRALTIAGIATPDLLYVGNAKDSAIGVLLFEYVHPAIHLKEIWDVAGSREKRRNDLRQLMILFTKMHEKGLVQIDLHLKNFLLKDQTIYCIDGASVREQKSGQPLKISDSLNNLALFFTLLSLQERPLVKDLFIDYARERRWRPIESIFDQLELCIERRQKQRIKKRARKVFRSTSELICRKSFTRFMVCKRKNYSPAMPAFLDNPDQVLDDLSPQLLKRGNTSTVARLKIDDLDLVVKRYNIKGIWHGVRKSFKNTRAAHSWKNAWLLLMLGVPTPAPVAMVERRFGPFRGKSYFIYEYVEGLCAIDFFKNGNLNEKRPVAKKIADLFKVLALAKISHGDMKGTNIIIEAQQPVLVDLDAMRVRFNPRRFACACKKDRNRFLKNWLDAPEVSRLFDDFFPCL